MISKDKLTTLDKAGFLSKNVDLSVVIAAVKFGERAIAQEQFD